MFNFLKRLQVTVKRSEWILISNRFQYTHTVNSVIRQDFRIFQKVSKG